jgi:hypothetical protein
MQIVLIIAGGLLGLWIGEIGEDMLGMITGALIGYLFSQRRSMRASILSESLWVSETRAKATRPDEAPEVPDASDVPDAPVKPAAVRRPIMPPLVKFDDKPASVPSFRALSFLFTGTEG